MTYRRTRRGPAPSGTSGAFLATKAGRYYVPAGGTVSTASPVVNVLYYLPIFLPLGTSLDRLGFEVTTAGGAGSVCSVGIYASGADGLPTGSPLAESSAIDTTSTGVKEATIAVTTPTTKVFLALVAQVSPPTLRAISGNVRGVSLGGTSELSYQNVANFETDVTGAMPAATATPRAGMSVAPKLYVRVA